MIGTYLVTLLMVGFIDQNADAPEMAIADEIRVVLARKGSAYPYYADYDLALPAQPRPSGGTEARRHFAESADQLYSEETAQTFTSKILLGPKTLLFSYDDEMWHALCTGPVDLTGTTPERWLAGHAFPIIPLSQLDSDLVANIRELLTGSTTLRKVEAGDLRTYHLASRIGPLTIEVGPARVGVARPAEGDTPPKVLFRYAHGTGKPPWAGAVAGLSARLDDPKAEVHRLAGEFTWIGALKASIPEFDGTVMVLEAAAQARLARRHAYLLPDPAVAKVVEAKAMNGQLHFKLESGGSTYEVSQYPKVSRASDNDTLKPFTKARRKLGDYAVLEIVDPGTGVNLLYYIKGDATLMVMDPDRRKLDFEDRTLDRVIGSFDTPR